jgi:hypothetical protein
VPLKETSVVNTGVPVATDPPAMTIVVSIEARKSFAVFTARWYRFFAPRSSALQKKLQLIPSPTR